MLRGGPTHGSGVARATIVEGVIAHPAGSARGR